MRLIDADALKKKIKKWLKPTDGEMEFVSVDDIAVSVLMEIEEQPTAYDVEKVVQCIHEYFTKKINDCNGNIVPHEILEYNKAICEIVRKGGVEL